VNPLGAKIVVVKRNVLEVGEDLSLPARFYPGKRLKDADWLTKLEFPTPIK